MAHDDYEDNLLVLMSPMISNSRALDFMISTLNENDISVLEKKVVWLSRPQMLELYPGYSEEEKSSDGFNRYCAGPCIAINATGESSVFNATLCLSSADFLKDVLAHIPTFNSSVELSPQDFYLFTSEPESSKHELSYIFQNSIVNLSSSSSISDCYFLSSNLEVSTLILISESENCLFENDFNSQILSNGFNSLLVEKNKVDLIVCLPGEPAANSDILSVFEATEVKKENKKKKKKNSKKKKNNETLDKNDDSVHELLAQSPDNLLTSKDAVNSGSESSEPPSSETLLVVNSLIYPAISNKLKEYIELFDFSIVFIKNFSFDESSFAKIFEPAVPIPENIKPELFLLNPSTCLLLKKDNAVLECKKLILAMDPIIMEAINSHNSSGDIIHVTSPSSLFFSSNTYMDSIYASDFMSSVNSNPPIARIDVIECIDKNINNDSKKNNESNLPSSNELELKSDTPSEILLSETAPNNPELILSLNNSHFNDSLDKTVVPEISELDLTEVSAGHLNRNTEPNDEKHNLVTETVSSHNSDDVSLGSKSSSNEAIKNDVFDLVNSSNNSSAEDGHAESKSHNITKPILLDFENNIDNSKSTSHIVQSSSKTSVDKKPADLEAENLEAEQDIPNIETEDLTLPDEVVDNISSTLKELNIESGEVDIETNITDISMNFGLNDPNPHTDASIPINDQIIPKLDSSTLDKDQTMSINEDVISANNKESNDLEPVSEIEISLNETVEQIAEDVALPENKSEDLIKQDNVPESAIDSSELNENTSSLKSENLSENSFGHVTETITEPGSANKNPVIDVAVSNKEPQAEATILLQDQNEKISNYIDVESNINISHASSEQEVKISDIEIDSDNKGPINQSIIIEPELKNADMVKTTSDILIEDSSPETFESKAEDLKSSMPSDIEVNDSTNSIPSVDANVNTADHKTTPDSSHSEHSTSELVSKAQSLDSSSSNTNIEANISQATEAPLKTQTSNTISSNLESTRKTIPIKTSSLISKFINKFDNVESTEPSLNQPSTKLDDSLSQEYNHNAKISASNSSITHLTEENGSDHKLNDSTSESISDKNPKNSKVLSNLSEPTEDFKASTVEPKNSDSTITNPVPTISSKILKSPFFIFDNKATKKPDFRSPSKDKSFVNKIKNNIETRDRNEDATSSKRPEVKNNVFLSLLKKSNNDSHISSDLSSSSSVGTSKSKVSDQIPLTKSEVGALERDNVILSALESSSKVKHHESNELESSSSEKESNTKEPSAVDHVTIGPSAIVENNKVDLVDFDDSKSAAINTPDDFDSQSYKYKDQTKDLNEVEILTDKLNEAKMHPNLLQPESDILVSSQLNKDTLEDDQNSSNTKNSTITKPIIPPPTPDSPKRSNINQNSVSKTSGSSTPKSPNTLNSSRSKKTAQIDNIRPKTPTSSNTLRPKTPITPSSSKQPSTSSKSTPSFFKPTASSIAKIHDVSKTRTTSDTRKTSFESKSTPTAHRQSAPTTRAISSSNKNSATSQIGIPANSTTEGSNPRKVSRKPPIPTFGRSSADKINTQKQPISSDVSDKPAPKTRKPPLPSQARGNISKSSNTLNKP
ncbi:hypothetical protein AYI70_g5363 [Smittium culicis]|uniref:Uncharacterized protein n=1 Tax=Smittium culicis TaxID=133412 RepID=A0A1R1XUY0_9FUNG|nr:hypothetical protein AYI70_g5363 [Smittium culicis]